MIEQILFLQNDDLCWAITQVLHRSRALGQGPELPVLAVNQTELLTKRLCEQKSGIIFFDPQQCVTTSGAPFNLITTARTVVPDQARLILVNWSKEPDLDDGADGHIKKNYNMSLMEFIRTICRLGPATTKDHLAAAFPNDRWFTQKQLAI